VGEPRRVRGPTPAAAASINYRNNVIILIEPIKKEIGCGVGGGDGVLSFCVF